MIENGFGYFSKDVAIELEITTSTLRRWSIELEKHGYFFQRNEKNQRIYYERDFKAFRELKKLIANSVPFSDAIKAVSSRCFEKENAIQTHSVYSETVHLSKRELEGIITNAIEKEHKKVMKVFEEKLNDTIETRDRLLTQTLRNTYEEKQRKVKTTWWRRLLNSKGEY